MMNCVVSFLEATRLLDFFDPAEKNWLKQARLSKVNLPRGQFDGPFRYHSWEVEDL